MMYNKYTAYLFAQMQNCQRHLWSRKTPSRNYKANASFPSCQGSKPIIWARKRKSWSERLYQYKEAPDELRDWKSCHRWQSPPMLWGIREMAGCTAPAVAQQPIKVTRLNAEKTIASAKIRKQLGKPYWCQCKTQMDLMYKKVYIGFRQRGSVARNDCEITIARDPKSHSW